MNRNLAHMLTHSEGRYFSELEEEQLRGYAAGLQQRLEILDAAERAEDALLAEMDRFMREKFPEMATEHGEDSYDRAKRDYAMAYRYASLATLMRDPDFVNEKLAVWLRSILFALTNRERTLTCFEHFLGLVERTLPDPDAAELVPHLEVVVEEMRRALGRPSERKAA